MIEKNYEALDTILSKNGINPLKTNLNWIKNNVEPTQFIVDNLIAKNSINFLGGKTGTGKSTLAMQLAFSLALGCDFLGWKTNFDGTVIYSDFELQPGVLVKRHQIQMNNNLKNLKIITKSACEDKPLFRFDDDLINALKEIGSMKDIFGELFLILDNITYSGIAISKNEDALEFINKLHDLQKNYDYTILVLGHMSKSIPKTQPMELEYVLGSTTLLGAFSLILGLGASNNNKNSRYLKVLKNSFGESGQVYDLMLTADIGKFSFYNLGECSEAKHLEIDAHFDGYLQALSLLDESGLTRAELKKLIVSKFKVSSKTAYNRIDKLIAEKRIYLKNGKYFRK